MTRTPMPGEAPEPSATFTPGEGNAPTGISRHLPLVATLLLAAAVFAQMLFHPMGLVNDDLTLFFPLNSPSGTHETVNTPGEEVFQVKFMPPAIAVIFRSMAGLFNLLGFANPIMAVSRFFGLLLIPATFWVFCGYLKPKMGPIMGGWAAFLVVAYNVANQTIPAGIQRSFAPILFGLFFWRLSSGKTFSQIVVIFLASLLYPVILPVLLLSMFLAGPRANGSSRPWPRHLAAVAIAFAVSLVSPAVQLLSYPVAQSPMNMEEAVRFYRSACFPQNLDVFRLSGKVGGQSLLDWISFNLFYLWQSQPAWLETVGLGCLVLLAALGAWKSTRQGQGARLWIAALGVVAGGAAAAWISGGAKTSFAWSLVLGLAGWLFVEDRNQWSRLPKEVLLGLVSGILGFLIFLSSGNYLGLFIIDPGRQIQKPFAVCAPIVAVLFAARAWNGLAGIPRRAVISAVVLGMAVLCAAGARLSFADAPHPASLRMLARLPADATILAHPETAPYILFFSAKSTSTAQELVRIAAKPYSHEMLKSYYRDVGALYAKDGAPVLDWCRQAPGHGYILVEKDRYGEAEIGRLIHPKDRNPYQGDPESFFLLERDLPCGNDLEPKVLLLDCQCLLSLAAGPEQAPGESIEKGRTP
ncbi:MAG: hypothetical protein AB1921_01790 [Thermodesulfobacteriota bacterium]